MIIKSKNFHIILGNGDILCMGDVYTNGNLEKGIYPELVNSEDFLKEVSNFALNLSEKNFLLTK